VAAGSWSRTKKDGIALSSSACAKAHRPFFVVLGGWWKKKENMRKLEQRKKIKWEKAPYSLSWLVSYVNQH